MPFKGISYLELWQPFSLRSVTICAILVEGIKRKNSVKLLWIWVSGPGGEFFSLATFLFSGAEPFMQFWKRASLGTFMWSYMKLGPVYQEDMSFKEKGLRTDGRTTDGRRTTGKDRPQYLTLSLWLRWAKNGGYLYFAMSSVSWAQ